MNDLNVGLVGLGQMGTAMAQRLASAGMLEGVYNRTSAVAQEFANQFDCYASETPAALAARSSLIVTVLSDAKAVADVYQARDGLLAGLRPGTLCVEMSTIGPGPVLELGEAVRNHDCHLVDAPVSGSVAMATAGELTILAGGDPEEVARARPVLEQLGTRLFHLGPLGAGATMKLAVNNVIYGLNQSLAESLVLAERAGIDRAAAYDVFAHSAIAAPFVHYRRAFFEDPSLEPAQMRMVLAAKDLDLITALAYEVGARLPQADLNQEVIRDAVAGGYGERDVTAVAEHIRQHRSVPRE